MPELRTTIEIGNGEARATVAFEYEPADDSVGFPGGVCIESVTLHHPTDNRRDVELVEGLLFDLVTAGDALHCECLESMGDF